MRRITDHRFHETGFEESIQNLVRNSPWWLTSAVIHGIALLILWNIPIADDARAETRVMQSDLAEQLKELEEEIFDEPEPDVPEEEIIEELIDPLEEVEQRQIDVDTVFEESTGELGEAAGPYTGPSKNTAIGLGPGGGGPGGRGSRRNLEGSGKNHLTENAVERGLKWLADHQDVESDGKWDCDDFMKHDRPDDRCTGAGGALYDVGATGLAVLAFLGANYTDRGVASKNPFAKNVRMGLRYLMSSQADDGVFGTRATHNFMYNHAIATLAMCEAYWMTRNPRYKKPAQEGLNYLAMARNPYMAWRYEPRGGDNDTSITGWCVMALKSGKYAGLEVDPDAFEGARVWTDKMTDPNFGQVGYNFPGGAPARPEGMQDRFPPERSQSMTAVGVLTRIFLGEDPRRSEMIKKGANLCLEVPPVWNPDDGSIDMYYWYYATLALFQVGGSHWGKWNQAMRPAIVEHQHPRGSGARTGSWDPIGAWGDEGGRVYSTAAMVMCLEVYYRYDRVFQPR